MPRIRLLVDVAGDRGLVRGERGDEIEVDPATAAAWADGERAERVIDRAVPVEKAVRAHVPRR